MRHGLLLLCLPLLAIGCSDDNDAASQSGENTLAPTQAGPAQTTTTSAPATASTSTPSPASMAPMDDAGTDTTSDVGFDDTTAGFDDATAGFDDPAAGYNAPQANAPPKSNQPANFAKWTPKDYQAALMERNPILEDAIRAYAQRTKGDAQAAALLSSLLEGVAKMPATRLGSRKDAGRGSGPGGSPADGTLLEGNSSTSDPASDPAIDDTAVDPAAASYVPSVSPNTGRKFTIPRPVALVHVLIGQLPGTREDAGEPVLLAQNSSADPAAIAADPAAVSADPALIGADPAGPAVGGPQMTPGGNQRGGKQGKGPQIGDLEKDDVIRALVEALAINGSPAAWQTIDRLLKGEIQTGQADLPLVNMVLPILVENYGGKDHPTHAILMGLLTKPEDYRSPQAEDGKISSAYLQQIALQAISGYAALSLDLLLGIRSVEQAIDPSQITRSRPAESRNRDRRNGSNSSSGGSSSSSGDFADAGIDDVASIDDTTGDPSLGLGGPSPGGPPRGPGGGRGPIPTDGAPPPTDFGAEGGLTQAPPTVRIPLSLDAEKLQRVVASIWQSPVYEMVSQRTAQSGKLGRSFESVALATSLPIPEVRHAVHELFQSHWEDGAERLSSLGLFRDLAHDPGLLVTLKMLPRERKRTTRSTSARNEDPEKLAAKYSWMDASDELVRSLNERLYAAAQRAGATTPQGGRLPVTLHPRAQITADYIVDWPQDFRKELAKIKPQPLRVRYMRIEQSGVPSTAIRHYDRSLANANRYTLPGVTWFDQLDNGTEPGHKRSLDVVITTAGSASQRGFLVEILEIEIPDPSA